MSCLIFYHNVIVSLSLLLHKIFSILTRSLIYFCPEVDFKKKKSSKKTHPQKVYSVAAQPSWKAGNLSSVLLHSATKIACCLLWCAFHLHLTSIMRPLFVTIISPTGEFIDAWIHVKVCLSHVLGVNFLKTTMKGIRRWRNKKKHSSWVILKEP